MSVEEYLVIGVVVGILFTEFSLVSPGGVIVPGYIAFFWNQPDRIVATVVLATLTLVILRTLDRIAILYGRRRFAASIVIAFGFRGVAGALVPETILPVEGILVIGWLIPAIIAVDMDRQGIGVTVAAMAGVTATTRLIGTTLG